MRHFQEGDIVEIYGTNSTLDHLHGTIRGIAAAPGPVDLIGKDVPIGFVAYIVELDTRRKTREILESHGYSYSCIALTNACLGLVATAPHEIFV
jgi:hypothetical protein